MLFTNSTPDVAAIPTQQKSPLLKKKKFHLSDAGFFAGIAAILAIFVLYVVYLLQSQTVAGGTNTVMRMDLYHQYGPLYAELYDRLTSGESLIYSWNTGLGSSFLGNLFNYCCSPFTLLILLFGHINIPESIAIIILLKASAAAAAFTYFINRVYGTRKASIAFGLLYAFCGYFVAFSWNVMWLDAFLMFPLVMLGIVFIIRKGKVSLYIAAMAYTMITNYYMAYMVCILSVIYFMYYYLSHFKMTDKLTAASDAEEQKSGYLEELRNSRFMMAGVKFALSSFLAFMLAAFALLPVYFILTGSSATSSSGAPSFSEWKEYFYIFDFLANHLANLEPTIRSSGNDVLPNIYCGISTLLLVPAFLFCKNISKRRKALTCVLLAFFYAGFALNFLNYFWHGMHYPNDLPYRYSFAYSFILLCLAYEAFLHIKEFSERFFIGTGVAWLAFIVLLQELGSKNIGDYTLMINIALFVIYTAVFTMISAGRIKKDTVSMLLVCIIICELTVANSAQYVMSQPKDSYTGDYEDFQDISETIDSYEAANDANLFYREERSKLLTRMDASWMDYNGISIFSSMAYETTSKLHRQLGLFSNGINSYTYNPQTAVYNSMFSLKYIYDKNNLLQEGTMYTYIDSNDTFDAYQYNYFLPIAFSVNSDMATWSDYGGTNPFINQNKFFELSTGIADVLENVLPDENVSTTGGLTITNNTVSNGSLIYNSGSSEGTATVTYTADKAGEYCVYFKSPDCLGYNITADNGVQASTRYSTGSTTYFSLNVGYLEAGQSAKVTLTYPENESGTANIYAVCLNEEKFIEGYNQILANGALNITAFEETYIQGTIHVTNENALLYTSIPYDKSWKISIDGVEVAEEDITPIADALLALHIASGEHTVEFTYEAQGLKLGVILSVIGIFIVLLMLLAKLLFGRKRTPGKEVPSFFIPADDTDMHTFEDETPDDSEDGVEAYKQHSVLWHIIICYLTFGTYYFVWKYNIYNAVDKFSRTYGNWKESNPLLLVFVPFYAPYWIANRSKRIADTAKAYGIELNAKTKWRLILGLVGGGYFAVGELEDDLNFFYNNIQSAQEKTTAFTVEQAAIEIEPIAENESELPEAPADETVLNIWYKKKTDKWMPILTLAIVFVLIFAHFFGLVFLANSVSDNEIEENAIEESTESITESTTIPRITLPTNTSGITASSDDSQSLTEDETTSDKDFVG